MSPVKILAVHTVSGDLEAFGAYENRDRTVLDPGVDGPVKDALDLVGGRRGGDIPVVRDT